MATPLVVPNAAMLTLNWTGFSRSWNNVYGLGGNPTLPVIDQAFVNTFFTELKANGGFISLLALMSSETILESISIRDIHVANLAEFTSTGVPAAGGATGDALPLSLAACVTIRTAGAGKSFRGRSYISGFAEGSNDTNGRIVAASNTAAAALVGGINAVAVAHSLALAVLSRPRAAKTIPAKTFVEKLGFMTLATAFEARNTKWESQRRRTGRS